MVNVGDAVPDFQARLTTKDRINKIFQLKDHSEDKAVLYFYPAAFTGVCTKSSCELRDDIEEFSKLGAGIYGVSTDSPFTHRVFIEKNEINYPMLSDWNREMIKAFEVEDNDFAGGLKGFAKRSLFLIENGVITYKWVGEHPGVYPPFDELKTRLKS